MVVLVEDYLMVLVVMVCLVVHLDFMLVVVLVEEDKHPTERVVKVEVEIVIHLVQQILVVEEAEVAPMVHQQREVLAVAES
jgi:hypothetical protein